MPTGGFPNHVKSRPRPATVNPAARRPAAVGRYQDQRRPTAPAVPELWQLVQRRLAGRSRLPHPSPASALRSTRVALFADVLATARLIRFEVSNTLMLMNTASPPILLMLAVLLSLVCWAFSILICRDDDHPRVAGIRQAGISPADLLVCLAFVLAVSGISLMAVRLPSFLSIP